MEHGVHRYFIELINLLESLLHIELNEMKAIPLLCLDIHIYLCIPTTMKMPTLDTVCQPVDTNSFDDSFMVFRNQKIDS